MAPLLQRPAPFFKGTAVVKGEFKEISLQDYKGKYLVVFFYPLDLWVHHVLSQKKERSQN